jgi:predicted AlkP superfamily phosphohydrolase/phosphomutase
LSPLNGEGQGEVNPILEIYQLADRFVGEIAARLDDDTTLLVISDHGFGPLFYNIYLNCWLYEHGYLVLKRNVTTLLKRLAWRAGLTPENLYVWAERLRLLDLGASLRHGHLHDLLGRVFLSTQNIDWPRTRAYSYGNVGQIYLNLKGREPQGCVEPADAPALVAEIIAKLQAWLDQASPGQASLDVHRAAAGGTVYGPGEARRSLVYRKEEIYWGEALDRAPEILVVPPDGVMAVGTTEFLSNRVITPTYAGSGWHRMEGIFIAAGKTIEPGPKQKLRIVDLFPTIVALLGLPIPEGLDGQQASLDVHLRQPSAGEGEQTGRSPVLPRSGKVSSPDEAWEKEIRQRLKGLGYI